MGLLSPLRCTSSIRTFSIKGWKNGDMAILLTMQLLSNFLTEQAVDVFFRFAHSVGSQHVCQTGYML